MNREHGGFAKIEVIPAKYICHLSTQGRPCRDSCQLKCFLKFTETARENIFNKYWVYEDINSQRNFILIYMVALKPKYNDLFYFD